MIRVPLWLALCSYVFAGWVFWEIGPMKCTPVNPPRFEWMRW
jgi:hypothetical protein